MRIFKKVELDKILIVDNSVGCFVNQLECGIPIKPYYGKERNDQELLKLLDYLKCLLHYHNIRKENGKYFKLQKIKNCEDWQDAEDLICRR